MYTYTPYMPVYILDKIFFLFPINLTLNDLPDCKQTVRQVIYTCTIMHIIWLLTLGSQHKWTNSKTARADIDNKLRNFIALKFLLIASLHSANHQLSLMTWIPQGFTTFYMTAIKWFLQTDKKHRRPSFDSFWVYTLSFVYFSR